MYPNFMMQPLFGGQSPFGNQQMQPLGQSGMPSMGQPNTGMPSGGQQMQPLGMPGILGQGFNWPQPQNNNFGRAMPYLGGMLAGSSFGHGLFGPLAGGLAAFGLHKAGVF